MAFVSFLHGFSYIVFLEIEFWLFNLAPLWLNDDQLSGEKWEVKVGNSFGLDKQQVDNLMYLSRKKKKKK